MDRFNPEDQGGGFRARPYGSSSATVTVAVIILVGALLIAAGFVLLRGNDGDGDEPAAAAGTATATSTSASLLPSATSPASATAPASPTTASTATSTTEPSTATTEEEAAPPTATEEPVETEEETAEETEEPEPTTAPTSEVEAPSEPTEEPATGEFGELPPAQLPSGGASTALTLDYQLGMSLEDLPNTGTVYQIGWPVLSIDQAQAVADAVGIDAEVVEEGNGIYRASGSTGTLYISPTETVYQSASSGEGAAPTEGEALTVALQWLQSTGLVGQNNDGGVVIAPDDGSGRIVTRFQPAEPSPILSPIPGATVTVGPGATVLDAQIHWQDSYTPSDYGFSAPLNLWEMVVSGLGYLEADLSGFDTSAGLTGTATITGYSIAYTISGGPAVGQYLTPVIVFEGTARIDQTGDEIPISVSVSAVYSQSGSSG